MTSPITAFAPTLSKVGDHYPISGVVSGLIVFNKAANTVQTTPKNPEATDATMANVYDVAVPTGATYLDLMTLFTSAAAPGTWPIVRCFGRLPKVNPAQGNPIGETPALPPKNVSSTYANVADPAWRPLGNLSTTSNPFTPTIGTAEFWTDGTFSLSEPVPINVLGVDRVRICISTQADQASMIVGNFGK